MSQTTVEDTMPIAVDGLLADNTMQKDAVSAFSEEETAEIPFGVMVAQGAADDGMLLLAAQADKLKGVTVFGHHYDRPLELGDDGMKPGVHGDVLRHGRIYVRVEDAVSPGDPVRVRAVAEGSEVPGAFLTADPGGTDTVDISDFAQWITSADAGELAVVEIDMTMAKAADADS